MIENQEVQDKKKMKELEEINNGFMASKKKEEDQPELTAEDVVANTLKSIKAD